MQVFLLCMVMVFICKRRLLSSAQQQHSNNNRNDFDVDEDNDDKKKSKNTTLLHHRRHCYFINWYSRFASAISVAIGSVGCGFVAHFLSFGQYHNWSLVIFKSIWRVCITKIHKQQTNSQPTRVDDAFGAHRKSNKKKKKFHKETATQKPLLPQSHVVVTAYVKKKTFGILFYVK